MEEGNFYSIHTEPVFEKPVLLKEILQPEETVPEKFYLSEAAIEKFNFLRGAKKIERTSVRWSQVHLLRGWHVADR